MIIEKKQLILEKKSMFKPSQTKVPKNEFSEVDWNKLKVFYFVAKHHSFSRAGSVLDVSVSTVSRQIKSLEIELNCALFIRTIDDQKKIILTSSGLYFFEKIKSIFNDVESALLNVKNKMFSTEIRIITATKRPRIWPYFKEIQKKYKQHRLSLMYIDDITMLRQHSFHFGILPKIAKTSINQILLRRFKLCIFASQKYIDNFGRPKSIKDLANHRMLSYRDRESENYINGNIFDWHLFSPSMGAYGVDPYIVVNDVHDLNYLVSNGYGIALSPEPTGKINNWINLFPEAKTPNYDLYFTYDSKFENSSMKNYFFDLFDRILLENISPESGVYNDRNKFVMDYVKDYTDNYEY